MKTRFRGDYLSNEIFYRVAKLRKENKPNLKTGHFHIKDLQEITKMNVVKDVIIEIIKRVVL
jgi:pyrrolidone-carboxylate peptidase